MKFVRPACEFENLGRGFQIGVSLILYFLFYRIMANLLVGVFRLAAQIFSFHLLLNLLIRIAVYWLIHHFDKGRSQPTAPFQGGGQAFLCYFIQKTKKGQQFFSRFENLHSNPVHDGTNSFSSCLCYCLTDVLKGWRLSRLSLWEFFLYCARKLLATRVFSPNCGFWVAVDFYSWSTISPYLLRNTRVTYLDK